MPIWKKASAETYFADGEMTDTACEVRIERGEIVVSYDDDDGPVLYRGNEEGAGHFKLSAPERKGSATLHRMPDTDVLNGFWVEGGWQGMWRIHLGESD